VLIADNGSSDGSVALAQRDGARVIAVAERGYGAALRAGVAASRGRFVVMGDADDSYDFSGLDPFIAKLRTGSDLVMGNRFAGGIAPGAMPFLHRYARKSAVESHRARVLPRQNRRFSLRLARISPRLPFWGSTCARPAWNWRAKWWCAPRSSISTLQKFPPPLAVDGRSRPPHLRTRHDGWRHLRFS